MSSIPRIPRVRRTFTAPALRVNVGQTERLLSMLAGGAIAYLGLRRRSLGGLGLTAAGGGLIFRGLTGHCPVYEALGRGGEQPVNAIVSVPAHHGVRVERSITILAPRNELYRFWRDVANLPQVMSHLESVTPLGDGRSHWRAFGPLGHTVTWDAEIHNDEPDRIIAWRSIAGSEVDSAGSVHFDDAPGGGTRVLVVLKYDPPGGKLGAAVSGLLGADPARQIADDLLRLKQRFETTAAAAAAGRTAMREDGGEG